MHQKLTVRLLSLLLHAAELEALLSAEESAIQSLGDELSAAAPASGADPACEDLAVLQVRVIKKHGLEVLGSSAHMKTGGT